MRNRLLAAAARATVLALALGLAASASAGSVGHRHPYFDDQGTLAWHTTWSDALAVARAEGKVVLVEFGRRPCPTCRDLVSGVLPDPGVRTRVARIAVGLAADCDAPEAEVEALFAANLPGASSLPFVAFVRADGRWITGFSGPRSVPEFQQVLAVAERAVKPAPAPARPAATSLVSKAERARAKDAAGRKAWGEVLSIYRAHPGEPELIALRAEAARWANERLDVALAMARLRLYDDAVATAEEVATTFAGDREGVDATTGIATIRAAQEAARLDPRGPVAGTVLRNAHERALGTRWVRLVG